MSKYILQIDTATEVCSVSVSLDGKLFDRIEATEPNLHASQLTLFIDEVIKNNQLTYQDLSAIAVSKGPGSYTGLRIGVSTAKGLCYALDIPLLAINTLESMYEGFVAMNDNLKDRSILVPMLDARRMEVYLLMKDIEGHVLKSTEAVIVDAHTFDENSNRTLYFFGSGAAKLKDVLKGQDNIIIDESYVHSSAYMSQMAYDKYANQDFEDLIYFEPFYLKEFIATTPKAISL